MAKVTISSVIDAPVEKVWARIRDFNGLPSWHPRMVESHIEDGKDAGAIGCVRNFQLVSGARIREKLLDFSDDDFPRQLLHPRRRRSRSPTTRRRCSCAG